MLAPAAPPTSSASRDTTVAAPTKIEPSESSAVAAATKPEADAAVGRRTDRRAALAAHLAQRPQTALARREAALQRSMRDLQRQCADLGRTIADVNARQGPLVQRLHAAQATLTHLSSAPATAGTAAVQALQRTLAQALQVHRAMRPSH